MSFAKARDLLRLAQIAASRRGGVCLEEICTEFGVSHRTAQRMVEALDATFASVEIEDREDRRRYWRLSEPNLGRLQPRQETTVEALEIAIRTARLENRLRHANALDDLRDSLIARLPPRHAVRVEADAEAVLGSLGHVTRPGPRVLLKPEITDAVIESLRGPFRLRIVYGDTKAVSRIVEPHGLLMGQRSYLVARQARRGSGFRNFRMDRIKSAECLDESFAFVIGFSLGDYAAKAFGAYQDEGQYGEAIWRFHPHAAERASEFQFHPNQILEPQSDGSLIVRFHAAGWLEMTWFLYQWGNSVEVIAPTGLRRLTEKYRRVDFEALP